MLDLCVCDLRKKNTQQVYDVIFKTSLILYLVFRMTALLIAAPIILSVKMIYSSVFINMSIYWFKKSNQPSNNKKQQNPSH